jgi:hypothetical protein
MDLSYYLPHLRTRSSIDELYTLFHKQAQLPPPLLYT